MRKIYGIILVLISLFLSFISSVVAMVFAAHWGLDGLNRFEAIVTIIALGIFTGFTFKKGFLLLRKQVK